MFRFSIALCSLVAAALLIFVSDQVSADGVATLRGEAVLNGQNEAPRMMPFINNDIREARNYPEQPPVIPHKTDGYIVDLNSNKCLSCHARSRTGESQAPMVSITHFMDREGQFRASVSPRRYFCNQCHVSQREVKPLVGNDFVDVDTLLLNRAKQQ
ncbi:nitrate reductase cytochrome c-type subunit [Pelagibius sp. Alg239-R121]|uniref:nitrate reductase cytochrome c-type subunit n=1 Tax=Pelagibius sp. Alg239-R121 TaxID=2993448 RepID=UPI0024A60E44|nr:nitrate reductase cytochrome c-type subunit [Pelagibius sp. Alg239-R121]